MNSIKLKKDLISKLVDACNEQLLYLKKELTDKSVFSYSIYCSSGCRNMGVAICTREGLGLRNQKSAVLNEPVWYAEVNSSEWDHVNEHYELFSEVDNFIDQLYETFYEGELEDVELDSLDDEELWEFISEFFIDVVVKTLVSLKETGQFEDSLFEKDMLFGIQFGDPDKYSIDMIEKSSLQLNSKEWHEKIQLNCDSIKSNI